MNGKVALQTVPKVKKPRIHHKSKSSKKPIKTPQIDAFLLAWYRFCITLMGCVVFVLEFFAGGFEGACKSGAKLMDIKEKI